MCGRVGVWAYACVCVCVCVCLLCCIVLCVFVGFVVVLCCCSLFACLFAFRLGWVWSVTVCACVRASVRASVCVSACVRGCRCQCVLCVRLCVCQCVCCVFLVLSFLGGVLYWTESQTTVGTHEGHSLSPADTDRQKIYISHPVVDKRVILFRPYNTKE